MKKTQLKPANSKENMQILVNYLLLWSIPIQSIQITAPGMMAASDCVPIYFHNKIGLLGQNQNQLVQGSDCQQVLSSLHMM